jgi:hypothetical protein
MYNYMMLGIADWSRTSTSTSAKTTPGLATGCSEKKMEEVGMAVGNGQGGSIVSILCREG